MTFKCADEALKATGSKLSDTELKDIRAEADRILAARAAGMSDDEVRDAVRKAAIEKVKGAKLQKAQAADSVAKEIALSEAALNEFAKKPWDAFRSIVEGISGVISGSRRSVRAKEAGLVDKYLGTAHSRMLEGDGTLEALWRTGKLDREVNRVLFALSNDEDPAALVARGQANENAVKIGRILNDTQNMSIVDAERRFIPIEKTDMYGVGGSHDALAMRKAGFDDWFKVFKDTHKLRLAADDAEFQRVAAEFFNRNTSGVFPGHEPPAGQSGFRSRARVNAQERAFVPRTADAWYEYNAAFGTGNLREAFSDTMMRRAKDNALADLLGVTPEKNFSEAFKRTADALTKIDPVKARKFAGWEKSVSTDLLHATGALNMPANEITAQWHRGWRAGTRTTIFGGSVLAQFSDLAFMAAELKFQGHGGAGERGLLSNAFDILQGIGRDKDAMRSVGFITGDYISYIGEAETGRTGPAAWMERQQNRFFRFNLMTPLANREAIRLGALTAQNFGGWAGRTFDTLPEGARTLFAGHRITPEGWNVIRQGVEKTENGARLLTAEGITNLGDDVFQAFKTATGDTRSLDRIRADMSDDWRAFLRDRVNVGLNMPGYRTRATLVGNTQAGTVEGEILRDLAVVKGFATQVLYSSIARELYSYGATNIREAFIQGATGEGFLKMMFFSTVLGYLAMSSKDLLSGKLPRDPTDPRTLGQAMMRGGVFGVYGDLLFGAAEKRFGTNIITALAGPQAQQIADVADLFGRATKIVNRPDEEKLAASFVRTAYKNIPGNNLFYVKPIVDYGFLNGLMDELSPGYLRRMEQRVNKEAGQDYWLHPSNVRGLIR